MAAPSSEGYPQHPQQPGEGYDTPGQPIGEAARQQILGYLHEHSDKFDPDEIRAIERYAGLVATEAALKHELKTTEHGQLAQRTAGLLLDIRHAATGHYYNDPGLTEPTLPLEPDAQQKLVQSTVLFVKAAQENYGSWSSGKRQARGFLVTFLHNGIPDGTTTTGGKSYSFEELGKQYAVRPNTIREDYKLALMECGRYAEAQGRSWFNDLMKSINLSELPQKKK